MSNIKIPFKFTNKVFSSCQFSFAFKVFVVLFFLSNLLHMFQTIKHILRSYLFINGEKAIQTKLVLWGKSSFPHKPNNLTVRHSHNKSLLRCHSWSNVNKNRLLKKKKDPLKLFYCLLRFFKIDIYKPLFCCVKHEKKLFLFYFS